MGVLRIVGKVVEPKDRAFLGGLAVIGIAAGSVLVAGAALLGLAFRVFEAAAGG